MDFEQLFSFVKEEHSRLMKYYGFKDKNHIVYPMALKVMEEMGELSEAILHDRQLQRAGKSRKSSELGEEFVDVILTTLLLAENFGIDIREELKKKTAMIEKRYA